MDSVFIVGPEINFLSDFGKKESSMVLVNISKEIKLNFVDGLLEKRIKYLLMKINFLILLNQMKKDINFIFFGMLVK